MTTHGFKEDFKEEERETEKEKEEKEKEKEVDDFPDHEKKEKEKGKRKGKSHLVEDESYWTNDEWQGYNNENWNEGFWAYEDETARQSQGWDEWQEYDEYGFSKEKVRKERKSHYVDKFCRSMLKHLQQVIFSVPGPAQNAKTT